MNGFAAGTFTLGDDQEPNTYVNTTTDDPRAGVVVAYNTATVLAKLGPRFTGIVSVLAERTAGANNNTREVFFVSNRYGNWQVTSLGAHTQGTAPTITLTGTGTYSEFLTVTITGGVAEDHTVYLQFSGIDRS